MKNTVIGLQMLERDMNRIIDALDRERFTILMCSRVQDRLQHWLKKNEGSTTNALMVRVDELLIDLKEIVSQNVLCNGYRIQGDAMDVLFEISLIKEKYAARP